ncbi:MAG: hypothetical protein QJR02_15180 [Sinobacteraceae bacterium]|nr:hypothetical protein [Nevskiaceae bacterium]MDI3261028.1 hypothetical protein [Nevskiaceae bacterium]
MAEPEQPEAPGDSRLLDELARLGRGIKHLFGAQLGLLSAELGLARGAIAWLLLTALCTIVAAVGSGLTALALVGVALAHWLGSWTWALAVLLLVQLVVMLGCMLLFRRCLHWMSLPATRAEWRSMLQESRVRAEERIRRAEQEDTPS